LSVAVALSTSDLQRICRDIAYAELHAMPRMAAALGARLGLQATGESTIAKIDWSPGALHADSLARMQLATAAATWCNAYDTGYEDLFIAKRNSHDWASAMQRARAQGAKSVCFSTSGSTGTAKHIRHREDVLTAEAQVWSTVLQQHGVVKRVVLLVPTHHIYGFIWGVLLPKALDVPLVEAELAALPEFLPGDIVIAVPDQWAHLARRTSWPESVQGVSSTAPLADQVHQSLTRDGNLARLLQIYGSTETAGIAYRDAPTAPYTLAPGRSRGAQDDVELKLPSGSSVVLSVQDEINWVSANAFNLLRRSDQSVQVGGHNVSPQWVTEQLLTQPQVRALEALPWYAHPASITYGTELPVNALGKPSDWQEA
jgi:long-chain acyl-CoA synthetase